MTRFYMIVLLLFSISLYAGDEAKLKYLVDYSLEHSPEYLQMELTHKIALLNLDVSNYNYKPNLKFSASSGSNLSYNSKYLDYSYSQDLNDWLSINSDLYDYLDNGIDNYTISTANIDINKIFTNYKFRQYRIYREIENIQFAYNKEIFKLKIINAAYDLVFTYKRLKVLEETFSHWKNILEYYRAKFDIGTISKIALLNAEVNYRSQENLVNLQEKRLSDNTESFKILIGYSLEDSLEVSDKVILNKFDAESLEQNEDYNLRISRLEHEIRMLTLKQDKRFTNGDLDFTSSYSDSGTSSNYSGMITYSFDFGKNHPKFNNQIAQWYESKYKLSLKKEILDSKSRRNEIMRRYRTLKRSLEISEKKLESATESYDYSKIAIQKGLISTLDLQDAQDKLTQAKLDKLGDIISFNKLKYEMIVTFGGVI